MSEVAGRLRDAEAIFDRVVELPPDERLRAIAEACRGDAELAREVRSLLAHEERLDGFLEQPALGARSDVPSGDVAGPDDLIGRRVGRYLIERRIASGGMGTVYLARQADGQLTREVALKVVKRGLDTDEILARFRRERQTLARLDHPNIARLLDGGATGAGQPWLAMEYVEGEPIDAWCRRRQLDLRRRLGLFLSVCDAVRYAHQNLVVHRDLKPGNILVTAAGVPKLLDFGIAVVLQADGPPSSTAPHERRWTPDYASPEQMAGRPVSTSTDVYSLGVILYELLCGRSPSRSTTLRPDEDATADSRPVPPSEVVARAPDGAEAPEPLARARGLSAAALRRRLRGDLDTIVMTALRSEPERRYASAEQLADDVRRHLEGLPVRARKDTLRYRAGKFVRRHAVGTSLALLGVLLLAAGAVAFAWQARVAGRERDEAFVSRDQAKAITGFLQDMLVSADPSNLGRDVTVHEALDAAAVRLDGDLADQPAVRASLRAAMGRTYLSLGLYNDAEDQLRRAHDERVALLGPRHHDVAESVCDLAELLYARGALDEAAADLELALAIFREVRGPRNPDVAATLSSLGAVRRAQDRLDEAEGLHREALEMRRALAGGDDLAVAESLNNLAGVALARGAPDAARELQARALEIRQRDLGPLHPLVIQSLDNLGFVAMQAGDLPAAEPLFREALAAGVEALGDEHPEVAVTRRNLARLLLQSSRPAEAETLLARSLAVRERVLAPTDLRLVGTRLELATALAVQGRSDEALEQVERVVTAGRRLPEQADERATILGLAARHLESLGQDARAAELRAELPGP